MSPTAGDRYIIAGIGGNWSAGTINDIAEWDGTAWVFLTPTEGFMTWVEDENLFYTFNGTAWVVTKYTDAEALAQAQTLDHDHATPIATHAALPSEHHAKTVSGDIDHDATVNFTTTEHFTMLDEDTLVSNSNTQAATQQSIKAYIDALFGVGSLNTMYIPLMFRGGDPTSAFAVDALETRNTGSTDFELQFELSIPTEINGYKLYIDDIYLDVQDADASNYGNYLYCYEMEGSAFTQLAANSGNWTTVGRKIWDINVYANTNYGEGGYIWVRLGCYATTTSDLGIRGIMAKCYYVKI